MKMNQGAASSQLVFDGSTGNQDIDVQRIRNAMIDR